MILYYWITSDNYYNSFPEYKKLKDKIMSLYKSLPTEYKASKALYEEAVLKYCVLPKIEEERIKNIELEIEKAEKKFKNYGELLSSRYPHKFIVADKLIEDTFNNLPSKTFEKRVSFDSLNGVLKCGDIKTSFHKGTKGDKPLLKLFRKLWNERKHLINGVEKKKGKAFPKEALAVQIGISATIMPSKIKSLNRKLQKLPAKVETANGVLLIVTEK